MIQSLIDFLSSSPVNFLAVKTICEALDKKGFHYIDARDQIDTLKPGDKVYFTKNDSSIYAFHIGRQTMQDAGFHIICAHCDSPTFRVKPQPEMMRGGMLSLNTEVYGGAILSTWFDRPLSLAGRVILRNKEDIMRPEPRLLHIKRPLLTIPNLAIHFNRQVNDGVKLSKQKDMIPLMAVVTDEMKNEKWSLKKLIADELGSITEDDILDYDLYLYDTTPACTFGLNQEFISAGRLDDLSMVHAALSAMLNTADETPDVTSVMAIFDNEEMGSQTKQGAGSPFLSAILHRMISVNVSVNVTDAYYQTVEKAFMISADNAHAWHPNYNDKYDPTNHPLLGGGPVIKLNAAQKYATDAMSAAIFQEICRKAGVPCQRFVNHSDVAGGSTLGNILAGSLPLRGVDMGNGVLAMHSCRETASCRDHEYCIKAFSEFYS